MTIEQFKNLFKQGNRVITDGIINLINGTEVFATIEFDDLSNDDKCVNFSYMDHAQKNIGWRGERSQFFGLQLSHIEEVKQMAEENDLFGDYYIKVKLPNMGLDIYFDLAKDIDPKKFGLLSNELLGYEKDYVEYTSSLAETKSKCINAIMDWEGYYVINVDSQDNEEDSPCIQVLNTFYNLAGELRNNELLNFSNISTESIHDNTSLFIEIGEVVHAEELTITEPDQFEITCERIFMFLMSDGSKVTIGLFE